MEAQIDATALDDTADSQASQASTTSGSSLAIQFSAEDLQENDAKLPPPASTESLRNEGKARRLNRRLALANLQLPKLSAKENCVIDLCTDEDRAEDLAWFKKKFPTVKTDTVKDEPDAVLKKETSPSKSYLPPSVATQRALKKELEKKLSKRRKAELEKRKELYMEDNEGLLDEEEEEEEEEVEKKKSKAKKRVKEPIGSDDDSEQDEDYKGDDEEEEEDRDSEENSGSDDEEDEEEEESADKKAGKNVEDLPESFDLFDGASTAGSIIKDSQKPENDLTANEVKTAAQVGTQSASTSESKLHPVESLNLMLDEGFDSQPMAGMSQPSFPNSLSQWFGDKPSEEKSGEEVPSSLETPEFVNIGTFSNMDPFKDSGEEDLLMFCSGRFDTQNLTRKDTSAPEEPDKADASLPEETTKLSPTSDDDEEEVHKSNSVAHKRSRKVIESDEEDEEDEAIPSTSNEAVGENSNEKESVMETHEESVSPSESEPPEPLTRLRRTIIDSDEEDDAKDEEDGPGNVQEEEQQEDEEEQDENEEEQDENDEEEMDQEEKDEAEAYIEKEADEDDSDDELAVIRRLQRSEFERKANREKWFDDEASLSGDDVGSDLDEDGDVANEYEAEEGDADDVPDSEAIRRQNHRLLLKQEKDRETLEIIRLQDRLLADGDLGGTETNRTFRLKLREDTVTTVEGEDGEAETVEEEEDTSSQAHARRVSAIKWLIEHEDEYQKVCNEKEEEDLFDAAVRSVQILPENSTSGTSKGPRTLLGQNGLENAIKEIAGVTSAKQLYVNNHSAAVKRPSSPVYQVTKKMRSSVSVLSILEQQ